MELTLVWLGIVSLAEILLYSSPGWLARKFLASFIAVALGAVSGQILGVHLAVWTFMIALFNAYRIINLLRLVEGRTNADYLYHVARRTSLIIFGLQLIILGSAWLDNHYKPSSLSLWYVLAAGQLIFALILVASTLRNLRTTKPPQLTKALADRDLPSLTVAIPARNETEDLELCLQSLVGSTYPKLEVLVLDDCSQNKRTPEIIREFAHDGIRFLAGDSEPEGWLAKNHAYNQLLKESNGELILFCGVDVRFSPDTLKSLVESLLQKKKSMFSVMPKNILPHKWSLEQMMVQPSRYAWELGLPRRWLNRPPVLSTCWIIKRSEIKSAGGFAAISHSNSPESYFAKAVAKHDGYSFICSDATIGLECAKTLAEQRSTAVRTRYPQLHRRPELTSLLTLLELTILVGPYIFLIASIVSRHWPLAVLSAMSVGLMTLTYSEIVSLTYRKFLSRGLWLLPFAAIYDICLLNFSMGKYEFSEVIWKGRNVCIPLMRVIPNLPKLK